MSDNLSININENGNRAIRCGSERPMPGSVAAAGLLGIANVRCVLSWT